MTENPESLVCTCGRVHIGSEVVGRNLNYDCPEHGVKSNWYNEPERVAKREVDRQRLIDLQLRARDARRAASTPENTATPT